MSDLSDFLLRMFAEDEAVARRCHNLSWEEWAIDSGDGEHIARHDPARVLADVAAKRRLLADETLTYGERANGEPSIFHWRVMTYLAQPYADHQDFQEEWRA